MALKRRRFFQSVLLAPLAPAALAAQQSATQQQPPPQPNTPARQLPRQPTDVPKLEVKAADLVSEPVPHFFTADQFATLQKLGSLLVPPFKDKPGAIDVGAPEFLDFLISVSPQDRKALYRNGLDKLDAMAREQARKPFSELSASQADSILRPLLVIRPWPEDLPDDPLKSFVAQVHQDLRTATTNSREWAAKAGAFARFGGRFGGGAGYYWRPIDPVVES
jgi:hypothetical protein